MHDNNIGNGSDIQHEQTVGIDKYGFGARPSKATKYSWGVKRTLPEWHLVKSIPVVPACFWPESIFD